MLSAYIALTLTLVNGHILHCLMDVDLCGCVRRCYHIVTHSICSKGVCEEYEYMTNSFLSTQFQIFLDRRKRISGGFPIFLASRLPDSLRDALMTLEARFNIECRLVRGLASDRLWTSIYGNYVGRTKVIKASRASTLKSTSLNVP